MAWSGLFATTINDYVRKEIVGTVMRKKLFLKGLQDNGRISYDGMGTAYTWPFRFRRNQLTPLADGDTNTFTQINKRKQASIPMRALVVTQALNIFNKLQNQGESALVKLWSNIVKELLDDARFQFNAKLLNIDGNSASTNTDIHGMASLFNNSGVNTANNRTYATNGTYAGVSQTLGVFGGSNTGGTWPDGQADPQYDAWTTMVISSTASGWNSATKTFAANSVEILRYGIVNTERDGYTPDIVILSKNYFQQHLLNLDSKERGTVVKGSGDTKVATGFGFGAETFQEGVRVTWDYDMPASTGYFVCWDELELKSWQQQLLVANTDWDIETMTDRVLLLFAGNLIAELPRCQSKVMD